MRAGSERVPEKNTRSFAGITGGLCKIKLRQLLRCTQIDKIFVSTNDTKVINISKSFGSQKIKIIRRPDILASSSASTDDLIKYVSEIMPEGHIMWTHVTSPFIGSETYSRIIEAYFKNLHLYDSLMTVTKLQKFIWNNVEPINYDVTIEKWPRTQMIEPLWEVNSGAFIATKKIYKKRMDRVGDTPFLFPLDREISFDIDWFLDFKIAEALYAQAGPAKNR